MEVSLVLLLLCNQGGKHSVMTTGIVWLPNGRVLVSSAGGPGSIPSQGPRHTKEIKNGTGISLV